MFLANNLNRRTMAADGRQQLQWATKECERGSFRDKLLDDFLHISTIHGWGRIFQRASKRRERLLWSFAAVTAVIIFAYITWHIGYIYCFAPLRTVISNLHYPIYKIAFPEVTVCNHNRLNWQRFEEAKELFLKPQHRNPNHERVFREVVNAYDTLRFGKFDIFRNITYFYPRILIKELDYVNFTQVNELMAWKCHEMITDCSWMGEAKNCCEIFASRKTPMGMCMAFNSIETEEGKLRMAQDRFYPLHTSASGSNNGLTLRIHLHEEWHSPFYNGFKGLKVMLVEPHVWAYDFMEIQANSRALIAITAFLQVYDDNTRLFSSDIRQCVFENELQSYYYKSLQGYKYMFENCQAECQQEYLMKFCNCTIDLFFPPGPYPACTLKDLACVYQHNAQLQNFERVGEHAYVNDLESGMNCPCYFSCKSLSLYRDLHIDQLSTDFDGNNTQIELSVFFLWESLKLYKTTAIYTILDLMASLGGLAGLCIGCSLVGVTELLYFLFLDVPKEIIACLKLRMKIKAPIRPLRVKRILVKDMPLN